MSIVEDRGALLPGHFPVPAATAALFGAFVARLRGERDLPPHLLAEAGDFSVEWLFAIERGEIELTAEMIDLLQYGFSDAPMLLALELGQHGWPVDPPPSDVDLNAVLAQLYQYPFGSLAMALRRRLNVSGWASAASAAEFAEPAGYADAFAGSARFLVFAPALAVAAVAVLAFRVLELDLRYTTNASNSAIVSVNSVAKFLNSVVWPLAIIGVIVAAFSLQVGNALLSRLARILRRSDREVKGVLETIDDALNSRGIEWRGAVQHDPDEPAWQPAGYLAPPKKASGDDEPRTDQLGDDQIGDVEAQDDHRARLPDEGLVVEPIARYLIPAYRYEAARSGLRARVAERMQLAFIAGSFLCGATSAIALRAGGFERWDLVPVAMAVLALAAVIALRFEINTQSRVCALQIGLGLGQPLRPATGLPDEKETTASAPET